MKESIPANRLIVYIVLVSFLAVGASVWWALGTIADAQQAYVTLVGLGEKIRTKSALQEHNRYITQKFRGLDPLFLHKKLEPLPLLSTEVAWLQKRIQRGIGPEDALLEKRLQLLNSSENKFSFVEGATEIFARHKETIEIQSRPVEVDNKDVEKVLMLLEGDDQDGSRPHCLITEFRLERKHGLVQDVWSLFIKVLRREYI